MVYKVIGKINDNQAKKEVIIIDYVAIFKNFSARSKFYNN